MLMPPNILEPPHNDCDKSSHAKEDACHDNRSQPLRSEREAIEICHKRNDLSQQPDQASNGKG
jgi:hypothetical protein